MPKVPRVAAHRSRPSRAAPARNERAGAISGGRRRAAILPREEWRPEAGRGKSPPEAVAAWLGRLQSRARTEGPAAMGAERPSIRLFSLCFGLFVIFPVGLLNIWCCA